MRRSRQRSASAVNVETATLIAASRLALDDSQRNACDVLADSANVYLTGPAGRGKTALLDAYVDCCPRGAVVRAHWHEFIRDLHLLIREHGGLAAAIDRFLGGADVLCFDELHVDDPADGIFLHNLIDSVVQRGVRLVITSNDRPSELMPNPLFHDTFRPAIELIERTCIIVDLDAGIDYRTTGGRRTGFAAGRWEVCESAGPSDGVSIDVGSRSLRAWESSPSHLGVDFDEICGRALSATDYLALARRHASWTIRAVPDLARADREAAQRFVHLIDVLYDADVPTTITTDVPPDRFARAGRLPIGIARMRSRLASLR
ncbi:hypothetical protein GOARA_056_00480 [Gordonia araii NBRC 100433]|uniref:ATPase n=1 Tax=Gordonia araii NBRC 100433 TaxID=1073574 RepID=G7H376_9ACTN|nr:cell division protein ZapE [Gordonia araii]NNG96419.1 cell division protein ZapE [Gordonia araii NBRC 100433]GAB10301.1 hypothetical protein GOARA_056_00480 [Gordonia araii NBRC 100433]